MPAAASPPPPTGALRFDPEEPFISPLKRANQILSRSTPAGVVFAEQNASFTSVKAPVDYSQKRDPLRDNCPVRAALDVIRGRWKPSILLQLKSGSARFSEIKSELKGATAQALSVQLRQLEADGVVTRTVFPEIPSRVEYALSSFGRTLSDLMDQLELWGAEYLRLQAAPTKRKS